MSNTEAIKLALSIVDSFKEAGNIYDDYKAHDGFTDEQYDEMLAALRAMTGKPTPMIHNKGTENEVTLRVVLTSDPCGHEYFDGDETLDAALETVKSMAIKAVESGDSWERLIGIAVVPKSQYGRDDGFGYGLTREYGVSDLGGFAHFDNHEDSDACNEFMDDQALGIDDDGYVLNDDDERMTYQQWLDYDCGF